MSGNFGGFNQGGFQMPQKQTQIRKPAPRAFQQHTTPMPPPPQVNNMSPAYQQNLKQQWEQQHPNAPQNPTAPYSGQPQSVPPTWQQQSQQTQIMGQPGKQNPYGGGYGKGGMGSPYGKGGMGGGMFGGMGGNPYGGQPSFNDGNVDLNKFSSMLRGIGVPQGGFQPNFGELGGQRFPSSQPVESWAKQPQQQSPNMQPSVNADMYKQAMMQFNPSVMY